MEHFQRGYTGAQAVARRGHIHTIAEGTYNQGLPLFLCGEYPRRKAGDWADG